MHRRSVVTPAASRRGPEPAATAATPVTAVARSGETAALEMPAFPEISDTAPVEEVLGLLQRRLEMLYGLVARHGGGR